MQDPLAKWRRHLTPIGAAPLKPPKWVVPGLLPPGLTLMAGDPKTYKSTLALVIAAAVVHRKALPPTLPPRYRGLPVQRGSVVVIAYEQSATTLRFMYEKRIARVTPKPSDYSFSLVKLPHEWQIDEPLDSSKDVLELLEDLQPTVLVIDPLVNAHSQDENDPAMIRPLIPLKTAALRNGTSVLLIHHANKRREQGGGASPGDWGRVRGTTALWGMADAGHILTRNPKVPGLITVVSEFKDFEGAAWTWKPPR